MGVTRTKLGLFVPLLSLGVLLPFPLSHSAQSTQLYVFGDSLVDVGNNNYLKVSALKANFPPYGIDYEPNSGRFSNGRVYSDWLAETYMGITSPWPYLKPNQTDETRSYGLNFASGGAGALGSTFRGVCITFPKQLHNWERYYEQQNLTPEKVKDALFLLNFGSNDWFWRDYMRNPPSVKNYSSSISAALIYGVKRLYGNGARKFVVFNTPAIGCTPSVIFTTNYTGPGCFQPANDEVSYYNKLLEYRIGLTRALIPDASIALVDVYKIFGLIQQKADYFGVPDNSTACCGAPCPTNGLIQCGKSGKVNGVEVQSTMCPDRTKYVYWDFVHPTEQVAKAVARATWEGNTSYISPMNLEQLVAL